MEPSPPPHAAPAAQRSSLTQRLARLVLAAFVFTFVISRILVLLIMMRRVPNLFFNFHGTHVHHLNYGIYLLSLVGAFLLFRRPAGRELSIAAAVYGVGLALTFDEFGMWLHLGGGYWQRASFDAVVIIAALLGLIVAAPTLGRFRPRHWIALALLAVMLSYFGYLLSEVVQRHTHFRLGQSLQALEERGPQ